MNIRHRSGPQHQHGAPVADQPTDDYRVVRDGWVAGLHRTAGTVLRLTAAAAKYEGNLVPVTAPKTRARRSTWAAKPGSAA